MMRLLSVSLLKLVRRPATRRTFVVMAAILALIYLSLGASARALPAGEQRGAVEAILVFPDAYAALASLLLMFAGLAAAAYAGAVAGSEWSWGVFRVAVTRGEARARYLVVTVAALGLVLLVGWLGMYALGIAFAAASSVVAGVSSGDPSAGLGTLPGLLLAGWWSVVMQAAIGFAAAFATRSQVAGIAAVVALMVGEQLAAAVVPADVLRLAPLGAGGDLLAHIGNGEPVQAAAAVGLIGLYLLAALGLTALLARRTEVA